MVTNYATKPKIAIQNHSEEDICALKFLGLMLIHMPIKLHKHSFMEP